MPDVEEVKKRPKRAAWKKPTQPDDGAELGFGDLGLSDELLATLAQIDFHTPTDIQREMIPVALQGRDCIGQAKTGTGKTAAFALPMIQRIDPDGPVQGLVLVPTRELAQQVIEHVRQLTKNHRMKSVAVYGGQRITAQTAQLKRGAQLIVGTPGRLMDMKRRRLLNTDGLRIVVLDEVDRMLDIGFRDDIRRILRDLPKKRQTIFVSATIDDEIRKLAKSFLKDPVEINVSRDAVTVESIEQGFVAVDAHDKFATLLGFLKHEAPTLVIVFTNTKMSARRVAGRLKDAGVKCKEIHGDLIQTRRDRAMQSFRKAHIQVLVATDLASRGIDVMEVSHIVNYDIPEDPNIYVHRVGRTARMGQTGYAITFVKPDQGKLLTGVEMHINKELPQLTGVWVLPVRVQKPSEPVEETAPVAAARLREALVRDEQLESKGLRPVRRTLGSRFKSSRRRRW